MSFTKVRGHGLSIKAATPIGLNVWLLAADDFSIEPFAA